MRNWTQGPVTLGCVPLCVFLSLCASLCVPLSVCHSLCVPACVRARVRLTHCVSGSLQNIFSNIIREILGLLDPHGTGLVKPEGFWAYISGRYVLRLSVSFCVFCVSFVSLCVPLCVPLCVFCASLCLSVCLSVCASLFLSVPMS